VKDVCEALVEDGDVDRLVTFAKICETAERYEDMVEAVKCMATTLSDTPMTGRSRVRHEKQDRVMRQPLSLLVLAQQAPHARRGWV